MATPAAHLELSELSALSPLDGRYRAVAASLAPYLSEWGYIRYRARVEVEYLLALVELGLPELAAFPAEKAQALRALAADFGAEHAARVKAIEKVTNHDVKALEYFLREAFSELGLAEYREFIHFGLTSQDVNDTAIPCALRDALREVVFPAIEEVIRVLRGVAEDSRTVIMLARTHGQPATPTRLGKELLVFVERLERELEHGRSIPFIGKFGGASGNLNAHYAAYPDVDWLAFADAFLRDKLALERARYTTQINHHDNLAMVFDNLNRMSGILLDLAQDFWLYIMQDYFLQEVRAEEVGSSAMPHKVNPIEFENAEGNLGLSSAILTHLSRKLAVSRLQRDLTDYTLKRNIGVALGHLLVACRNVQKGLRKLSVNRERIAADLDGHFEVVAEAVQTILRRTCCGDAYEQLKQLTRGRKLDPEQLRQFVTTLSVPDDVRERLAAITPATFVGPLF